VDGANKPVDGGGRWRWAAALLPPVLLGSLLRCWELRGQVLGGDELHGVRAAVALSPGEVLTTYGLRDYSLPLTALASWLLRHGVALDELGFRLPSLAAGILLVGLLPMLVARAAGWRVATWLGWLLALSPLLVLYSRVARSYLPVTLAAAAAVLAFHAWWEGGGRRWAAAYVGFAGVALWLHLGSGPILVAPFLFAVGDAVRQGRHEGPRPALRRLTSLALVGLALGAVWLAFLLPAVASLRRLTAIKHTARFATTPAAAWNALQAHAGSSVDALAIAFWLLAAGGLVLLARERARFSALTAVAVAGQVVGLWLLAPRGGGAGLVLARYLLVALPLVLVWVARALAEPWLRRRSPAVLAARAGGAAFVAVLFACGPLPSLLLSEEAFAAHNLRLDLASPAPRVPAELVPAAYSRGSGPVLVAPWPTTWNHGWSAPLYQERHGREVLVIATAGEIPRHPALRLRNAVAAEPGAILASRADALVVHLRLGAEEARLTAAAGHGGFERLPAADRRRLRRDAERLVARLRREWGRPDHAGEWTVEWNLRRVRGEDPFPQR
jgi:hypothetical protein